MRFENGEDFLHSLVEDYCPEPQIADALKCQTYFNKLHNMFYEAIDNVKTGDKARAYIALMRYSQLGCALPQHREYKDSKYDKERARLRKKLEKAILKLEQLKPEIVADYNAQIEAERNAPPPSAMAAIPAAVPASDPTAPPDVSAPPADVSAPAFPAPGAPPSAMGSVPASVPAPSGPPSAGGSRWANLRIPSGPPPSAIGSGPVPAGPSGPSGPSGFPETRNSMDSIFDSGPDSLKPVIVPENVVADFVRVAQPNTRADIETCGVLAGRQDANGNYLITTVIIPKQKGSPNTVQTLHEEELIDVQERESVITMGWIHTHPSQTCFLSSVDMHCQLSYQIMMPSAIAIVHSPSTTTTAFSLSPNGVTELSNCSCQGFHPHERKEGMYGPARHVSYTNATRARFIDLRGR